MAKFLSDRSAQRLGPALDAIESLAPRKNNAPRRRIRSVGGGVSEYWVTITSVTSPSEYVGTVREEPTGTVLESDANITVYGATANEFAVGYADWAKKKTNSGGDDIYYLNGYLLG